jgi:hypothetical protein
MVLAGLEEGKKLSLFFFFSTEAMERLSGVGAAEEVAEEVGEKILGWVLPVLR